MNVFSIFLANWAVGFASMSRSIWTSRSLRHNSINSKRSSAFSDPEDIFALGCLTELGIPSPVKAYSFGNRRSVQAKFLGHPVGVAACENQLNKLLSVLR